MAETINNQQENAQPTQNQFPGSPPGEDSSMPDVISQLVQQISAAEISNISQTDSPKQGSQTDRQSLFPHSPISQISSRSKSPIFTTKYKQSMLKNMKQQKAVFFNAIL